jgi:hypothetical protein
MSSIHKIYRGSEVSDVDPYFGAVLTITFFSTETEWIGLRQHPSRELFVGNKHFHRPMPMKVGARLF